MLKAPPALRLHSLVERSPPPPQAGWGPQTRVRRCPKTDVDEEHDLRRLEYSIDLTAICCSCHAGINVAVEPKSA